MPTLPLQSKSNQIRQQLQNGKTIQEVCKEYHLTFKELCQLFLQGKYKRTTNEHTTGKLYITSDGKRYILRKDGNHFGSYNSLDDAVKVRDYMIMNGWYRKRLDGIRKELGV